MKGAAAVGFTAADKEDRMRLIIGGASQGKLDYAMKKYSIGEKEIMDGRSSNMVDINHKAFYAFETWFKRQMKRGGSPEEMADTLISGIPELTIICNEVGCGIVPVDPFEREYRERLGRYLIKLAGEASAVDRVFCGTGHRIK